MRAYERLLNYVVVHTASDEFSETTPTTQRQFDLANMLVPEMKALGIEDARVSDLCCVYGTLPATLGYEDAPAIGLIAHLDTVPDFCGEHVKPRIIENYDGGDVVLGDSGRTLSPAQFPHLPSLKGRTLIVTDGTTVLGADDKAGIAEIVSAVAYLKEHPEIKHGKIRIGFNPDEEIGLGAHKFNVEQFGCEWAYTMDGGEVGELEFENFNAASAKIVFKGRNVHPGYAKGKMRNSMLVAAEFIRRMPSDETPQTTEGYEGFYHLMNIDGTVEEASASYIIRDFETESFEKRKDLMKSIADQMNAELGSERVLLTLKDQYYNMKQVIEKDMTPITLAKEVMEDLGITPIIEPIRGGTDGSKISFMGIPTPNIFAGGENMHGRFEYVSLQTMERAVDTIIGIVTKK